LSVHTAKNKDEEDSFSLRKLGAGLAGLPRVLHLVWSASPLLTAGLAFFTLLRGITPLITITITRMLLDGVVNAIMRTHSLTPIWPPVILQLVVSLLDRFCGVCSSSMQQLLQDRAQDYIQLKILQKADELDLSFYENADFYDKMRQASQDAMYKPLNMVVQTFGLGRSVITLISMLILLFHLAWWLAIIALITPIPSFIADSHYSLRSFRMSRFQSPKRRLLQYLVQLMTYDSYNKEIKLFNLGDFFIQRYHSSAEELYAENKNLILRRIGIDYALSMLPIIVNSGIYLYVALQAILSRITLGGLTQYTQAVNQTGSNFQSVLDGISSAYENNLFVSTFFEFLTYEPRILSPEQPVPLHIETNPVQGLEIEFRNVSFTYPTKLEAEQEADTSKPAAQSEPALKQINFTIRAGETIALVGYNGSGKTTLIKLLTRLYDPDEGEILINGHNIKEYALDDLHNVIGVIFQDFVHYQLIASENIGVGNINEITNIELIEESAQKSGATAVVQRLPEGYETTLGKWFKAGVQLSGGEWQKIAIARAFMRDAPLLILDEPTSALDARAEYEVFSHFKTLTRGKTSLYISHRFSTVRQADRIFVMEYGQIIECGSHDELMRLNGRYAELFLLQAEAYRD
jgi:ATP-binding cassette subfamily B protein